MFKIPTGTLSHEQETGSNWFFISAQSSILYMSLQNTRRLEKQHIFYGEHFSYSRTC